MSRIFAFLLIFFGQAVMQNITANDENRLTFSKYDREVFLELYDHIHFMNSSPVKWYELSKEKLEYSFFGLRRGHLWRIVEILPEEEGEALILLERIFVGPEGCCLSHSTRIKLDLSSIPRKYYRARYSHGFEFLKWQSPDSFLFAIDDWLFEAKIVEEIIEDDNRYEALFGVEVRSINYRAIKKIEAQ